MRNFHNIEKATTRKGEYVGYGRGGVYRLSRYGRGWIGKRTDGTEVRLYDKLTEWSYYLAEGERA